MFGKSNAMMNWSKRKNNVIVFAITFETAVNLDGGD